MKKQVKRLVGIAMIFCSLVGTIVLAAGEDNFGVDGRELAQLVRNRENGEDFSAQGEMELIDKNNNSRARTFVIYRKDKGDLEQQVLRFMSPADIAGTAFLSIELADGDTEQFLFLPALKRTRRIVSSQKGHSFVNTDFTYEDMERRNVDLWDHKVVGTEKIGSADCYILESSPKKETKTEYSMIKSWVIKDVNIPIKVDYYNKKTQLFKEYRVNKVEKIQGIWTEVSVSMFDLVASHRTVMKTKNIVYNSGLSDDLFTEQNLERW